MMKKMIGLLFTVCLTAISFAQDLDNPGAYMSAINNASTEMNQRYMAYTSAAAHGKGHAKLKSCVAGY